MSLTEHFTIDEMTHTDTGIDNVPSVAEGAALLRLCETVLEPMRAKVGRIKVNSGYRSIEVNLEVGGAANSQHCKGEAADLFPLMVSPGVLFDLTKASNIPFDQLILEPDWVHVSVAPMTRPPRRQCLKAVRTPGGMRYEPA